MTIIEKTESGNLNVVKSLHQVQNVYNHITFKSFTNQYIHLESVDKHDISKINVLDKFVVNDDESYEEKKPKYPMSFTNIIIGILIVNIICFGIHWHRKLRKRMVPNM